MGAEVMVKKRTNPRCTGTNTKRSQIAFAVTSMALSLQRLGTQLLGLSAQSLIKSSGTLPGSSKVSI